jgi:hypothetical protein
MEDAIRRKADLMINNFYAMRENFRWNGNLVKHFGAMVHATSDKNVDIRLIEGTRSFIKEETGVSSYFRGTNGFIIANLLCFEDNYKDFFRNMLIVYYKLKEHKFRRSPQLPLAAYTITKESSPGDWDHTISRTEQFYKKMKQNHFWLTSSDDYVFAAVLGTTSLDPEETSEKIEDCYNTLYRDGLYRGNYLQTLSHVLALGEEEVSVKCSKAMTLYHGLKDRHCTLRYNGLATLGLLTLVTPDTDKTITEAADTYDYIYNQKGYGFWSLDKSMRAILASTLVADYYVDEIKKGVLQITLSNSINAIIIAQQQAAIAAACAASAAAASSSSS